MSRRLFTTAAFVAWLAAPVAADLRFTMVTASRPHPASAVGGLFAGMGEQLAGSSVGQGTTEAVYIVGKRGVRTEYVDAVQRTPAGSVSLLLPDGRFIMMNPADRTYWKTTLGALRGQLEAAERQAGTRASSSSGRTGEITTIAGLRAERVALTWSMPLPRPDLPPDTPPDIREMFADWPAALTIEGEVWVATDKYRNYAKAAAQAANAFAPIGMNVIPTDRIVLRSTMRSFGIEVDAIVTAIGEVEVPASLFEIPAGYREVPGPFGASGGSPEGEFTARQTIDNAAPDR